MSSIRYEIWERPMGDATIIWSGYERRLVASGTIEAKATMSAAVSVPKVSDRHVPVGIFRVVGSDAVYLQASGRDKGDPVGAGAQAATDDAPRVLVDPADGRVEIPLPVDGRFAIVKAGIFA